MKTVLSFLMMCIAYHLLPAQSLRYSIAQPYVSLSAYSKLHNDPLSFTGNQAVLAQVKDPGIAVFGERRFMLGETSTYTLGASLPTRLGNFGIQLNYAGFTNFNETRAGVAYARKLGKLVDVGIQFNYYGYRVPASGNASTINFEIGTLLHLTDKLNAGIHIYNPVGGKLGSDKAEKLASAYKAGLGYDISERFFISAEIIKEEDMPVNVTAGLQYQFAGQFFLRTGFQTVSTSFYTGAGLAWKNLRLDITSGYHPQLGFSPGILIMMNFKAKEK